MIRAILPALFALTLAACSGADRDAAAPPQPAERAVLEKGVETGVLAPNSSIRLVSRGDGEILISAGFFNRNGIAEVGLPSRALWAPDSRRLFINDSASPAWSAVRVFEISSSGDAVEHDAVHRAAVAELGRRNGCATVPEADAATSGMAWAAEGRQIYVLAEARRQTGDCQWGAVSDILVVADAQGGRLLKVLPGDAARLEYPGLPWG